MQNRPAIVAAAAVPAFCPIWSAAAGDRMPGGGPGRLHTEHGHGWPAASLDRSVLTAREPAGRWIFQPAIRAMLHVG